MTRPLKSTTTKTIRNKLFRLISNLLENLIIITNNYQVKINKCSELNTLASSLNSQIMVCLSRNLRVGQQMSLQAPLALFQISKQKSSQIAGEMTIGDSRFSLPSFCSMANTLNCNQSAPVINIQVWVKAQKDT